MKMDTPVLAWWCLTHGIGGLGEKRPETCPVDTGQPCDIIPVRMILAPMPLT